MAWTIGRRMGRMRSVKIRWHVQKEHRFPFGSVSPDPDWFEPIGFPPPWPDRPWVYAVMVASANGVVAWPRSGPDDDPVLAILGRDDARDERIADRGAGLMVEPLGEPEALRRAHARLFAERSVRYLDCEGGQTVLRALRQAGLLDEVFLTETDVVVDESRHRNVLKIFEFEQEGADLIAEGRTGDDSPWRFRRWRFSRR